MCKGIVELDWGEAGGLFLCVKLNCYHAEGFAKENVFHGKQLLV